MAQDKGKVDELIEKGKNYFVTLDNEMRLSGWLNKMPENLEEGVSVMLTYTVNGKYNNIDSVMVVPEGGETAMNVPVEEVHDNKAVSYQKEPMKVKVVQEYEPGKFEIQLNEFGAKNKVEFTQTHVTPLGADNPNVTEYKVLYVAVVWYRELK